MTGQPLAELITSGLVFAPDSVADASRSSVKYDLRLDAIIRSDGRPHRPRGGWILAAGAAVAATTIERHRVDWSVYGQIGPKYRNITRGVFTLCGSVLDPGFGLKKNGEVWVPADEPMQFILANFSETDFPFRYGDPIASVQLYRIDPIPPELRRPVEVNSIDAEPLRLGFVSKLESRVRRVERQTDTMSTGLSKVESGTTQVIMFGVYILAVAVLAATFNNVVQVSASAREWVLLVAALLSVVATIIVSVVVLRMLRDGVQGRGGRSDRD